jgi:hypothetical protein
VSNVCDVRVRVRKYRWRRKLVSEKESCSGVSGLSSFVGKLYPKSGNESADVGMSECDL